MALVRAMALGAPLLLMDEPFAALDEITRAEMRHLLAGLCEQMATTVVFVTHSVSEAVYLSDRVVVLSTRPGRIVGIEPIELARPAPRRARGRGRLLRPHQTPAGVAPARSAGAVTLASQSGRTPVGSTSSPRSSASPSSAGCGSCWCASFDVQEFILPPPSTIASEIADNPRFYLDAAAVTARHAYLGMLIALVRPCVGSLLATSRFLEQAAQPLLVLILVAPWVAYFASIVAWLGPGDPPVLFLVSLVAVPGFVFATVSGLRSADPAPASCSHRCTPARCEVLWRLRLPSALPGFSPTARFVVGIWRSPPPTTARAATCR